eukprot:1037248-Pelagomonas_calceolata.AAC.1
MATPLCSCSQKKLEPERGEDFTSAVHAPGKKDLNRKIFLQLSCPCRQVQLCNHILFYRKVANEGGAVNRFQKHAQTADRP